MIASVLSVTLLGVAAAQEPAPVASSVANTERFGLCAAPATAPRARAGPLGRNQSSGALGRPPSRLNTKTRETAPRPQAADVTCPVPWVMNAPTVGCLACGQKLEYAYTAMATTPWQVVAFENHDVGPHVHRAKTVERRRVGGNCGHGHYVENCY